MTTPAERALKVVLRVIGTSSLLAIPFVVAPSSWLDGIHRALGLGPLPEGPIVGYLARSTSAFYAMFGGLFWLASFDPRRLRPVLLYLGVVLTLFGVALFGIDLLEGLPTWWTYWEGPFIVALGATIGLLARKVPDA